MINNNQARAFLERLRDAQTSNTGSVGRLKAWLEKHTYLHNRPFSTKGHEFQDAILDSTATQATIIKPSQVGLSELSVRLGLAFLANTPSTTAIYAGPSVSWIQDFVKSRIDPVIIESPTLSNLVRTASDSTRFKMIGTSQLRTVGLYGTNLVISIPTDLLIIDELDFCSDTCVRSAESRLSHSRFVNPETDVRGLKRYFSTPTGEDVGVWKWFQRSNMQRRLCRCRSCSHWFHPSFLEHVVVDGFDKHMREMTALTVQVLDRKGYLDSARMLCPKCRNPITKANLMPEFREWVAEHPDVRHHDGFHVVPWDVPDYHTPASMLRKLQEYGSDTGNFYNFSLGLPWSDATNSVLPGVVEECTTVNPIPPEQAVGQVGGTVMGVDIGKISWVVIAKPIGNQLHEVWKEQIHLHTEDGGGLLERLLYLARVFRVAYGVIDIYPYTDVVTKLIRMCPMMRGAEFTIRDSTLPMYVTKEETVSINRTKFLDLMVKRVNNKEIQFSKGIETTVMEAHLRSLRKVDQVKEKTNTKVSEWLSSGDDHYAFALSYAVLASQILTENISYGFAAPVTIREAYIGKAAVAA